MKTIVCNMSLVVLALFITLSTRAFAQVRVSETSVLKVEPHLAVNPTDPRNIVVVAITDNNQPSQPHIGAWYTTNQGVRWFGSDDMLGRAIHVEIL